MDTSGLGTRATLNGFPIVAEESVGWKFTRGVEPYQRTFRMEAQTAQDLWNQTKGGAPVELRIEVDGFPPLVVKKLTVKHLLPSRAPYLTDVLVSDCRWKWRYKNYLRRVNMRRRTGEYRFGVEGGQMIPIEKQGGIPDVKYAKYSLEDETKPWEPRDLIEDALKAITEGYSLLGADLGGAKQLNIEGMEFDDDGATTLQRMFQLVPNLTCWVDENGITQLTLESGGGEVIPLSTEDPLIVGPTTFGDVDFSRLRPKYVDVLFTTQDELRFDFFEPLPALTWDRNRPPRILENVMPLPDPYLSMKLSDGTYKIVVQGTWVVIDQNLFDAWNSDLSHPATVEIWGQTYKLPPISFERIQQMWFTPGGYNAWMEVARQSDPVWARRWAAIMRHYRQTFRVRREWVDRILEFRDERPSIVDPTNGIMAPTNVYSNYAVIPTARALARTKGDPTRMIGFNVPNYTAGDLLANSKPAALATVDVLDQDQGILRVEWSADAWGDAAKIVPSGIVSKTGSVDRLPTFDPRDARAGFMLRDLRLAPTHACALVLSVFTASPNTNDQLYRVRVYPEQARSVLPASIANRIKECEGPPYELRIGPTICRARFAWRDDSVDEIREAIFAGGPRSPLRLLDPEQIVSVAQAAAGGLYSAYADRYEGMRVTAYDPNAKPVGRIESVAHSLAPTGAWTTTLDLPAEIHGINVFALLPESVRRVILHQVKL